MALTQNFHVISVLKRHKETASMALTQNFHVISVLKRHKETVHGTNPELSCDICVEETQRDCSWH